MLTTKSSGSSPRIYPHLPTHSEHFLYPSSTAHLHFHHKLADYDFATTEHPRLRVVYMAHSTPHQSYTHTDDKHYNLATILTLYSYYTGMNAKLDDISSHKSHIIHFFFIFSLQQSRDIASGGGLR